jgi:replication initiation protein RepC
MQTQTISDAPRHAVARAPTGLRRLSLAMLATAHTAEAFTGLPEGTGTPGKVLAAFKGAAPYLGLAPRLVHAIDWLFKFTQAQDWGPGSRPVVWPSASLQREALGLGPTQVKALNRALTESGLVVMKDSPNGKRYGKRDPQGRIVEAYGFDLSPLAARQAEFLALAAQGRAEREQMRRLRRRATITRNGLLQILETVTELGLEDDAWQRLDGEVRELARALQKVEHGLNIEKLSYAATRVFPRPCPTRSHQWAP